MPSKQNLDRYLKIGGTIVNKDCNKVHELLISYINRQLSPEENSFVILHIAQCPECQKEAAELILLKKHMIDILEKVPQEMYSAAFKKVKDTVQDNSNLIMKPQDINMPDNAIKIVFRIMEYINNANKLSNSTADMISKINNCKSLYILFDIMHYIKLLTKNTISLPLQII